MNTKDFNLVVDNRIKKIKSVLASKAGEYSSEKDRLHNFKIGARIKNESPEQALWGVTVKHLVSIIDLIEDADKSSKLKNFEYLINEKIGDMINYLILLEGLLLERKMDL